MNFLGGVPPSPRPPLLWILIYKIQLHDGEVVKAAEQFLSVPCTLNSIMGNTCGHLGSLQSYMEKQKALVITAKVKLREKDVQ